MKYETYVVDFPPTKWRFASTISLKKQFGIALSRGRPGRGRVATERAMRLVVYGRPIPAVLGHPFTPVERPVTVSTALIELPSITPDLS
jgi:hypothetical protein